jgi:hypothetical protein
MTEAAYFWSKEAEIILSPYVQVLVGAETPPTISSPLSAATWDYKFDGLLVDLKLAMKAGIYGRLSHQTLADIKKALRDGVLVALLVPPRLYLLFPYDLTWDGGLETLWNKPSILLPKNVLEKIWELYQRMTN